MEILILKEENTIKDIINLFMQENKTKAIKDRILRDIKNLFEHRKEEYFYKVSNFWSNNYIRYEGTVDRNKSPSVEEYLIKLDHI